MMEKIRVDVYDAQTGTIRRTQEKTFSEIMKWAGRAGERGYWFNDDGEHDIRVDGGDHGDARCFFIIRNVR